MGERCRFCYKVIEGQFCRNIFDNKQTNPSICKIVEMLTSLTIVENDPYTKLSCEDCFDVLILFYHFRESVLQTNRLLINNKSANTNNNQNIYNNWPGIVRDNNGRRFILIDNSLHRETDSDYETRKIDENHQDSNKYIEQSQKNSVNQEVFSFLKEEYSIEESCLKIENHTNNEHQKIEENHDSTKYNEQFQKNSPCIDKYNQEVLNFIKQEFDIKKENDCYDEDEKIDEYDQHLSIPVVDDNIETIRNDNKIISSNNFNKYCLVIKESGSEVGEYSSIIDADFNEDQEMQNENSNKSVDDSDNSDKRNDIAVLYVQNYNERLLEPTSTECQENEKSNQHKSYKKHSMQPHQCNMCNKKFRSKADLKRHLLIHTGEKAYQCDICSRKFSQKQHLKQHLLIHTGEKPHQCNICDKKFTANGDLKKHLLTHTGEKPHQCNICSKRFTLSKYLKVHLLTHTGEKPHQCHFCDEKFTRKEQLKQHSLSHTTEKTHQCNICDQKFTLNVELKRHLLTHNTDERPHACIICDENFTRKQDLKRHLMAHAGEKPHQCNNCDKRFTLKGDLKRHLLTHTGEKPNQCNMCDKKYSRRGDLKKHLLTQHSV